MPVKVGGRRFMLSPSDLVFPLCCGVFVHVFFVAALCGALFLMPDVECGNSPTFVAFVAVSITCHTAIVIVNVVSSIIAFRVQVLAYSKWLHRMLYLRLIFNWSEAVFGIWGVVLVFALDWNCIADDQSLQALLIFVVVFNWVVMIISWCSVYCFSSADTRDAVEDSSVTATRRRFEEHAVHGRRKRLSTLQHEGPDSTTTKWARRLRWMCCACLWEERSWNQGEVGEAFSDMASLLVILTANTGVDDTELVPSDAFTGLQLLRMLQKHFLADRFGLFRPMPAPYKYVFSQRSIADAVKDNPNLTKSEAATAAAHGLKPPSPAMELVVEDSADKPDDTEESSPPDIKHDSPPDTDQKEAPGCAEKVASCLNSNAKPGKGLGKPLLPTGTYGTFPITAENRSVPHLLDLGAQPRLNREESHRIDEGVYYVRYAIGSYGLPLYTLEYPCGICCAMPCGLPSGVDENDIYGNACCWYSSLKVFLRRTGITGVDLLMASQFSGINQTTFFVAVDKTKQTVVFAIRGTESIPDSVTDAACFAEQLVEVDNECFAHAGMTKSARNIFRAVNEHPKVQTFLDNHREYNIIVTGHSLGAGVAVLLTMIMQHSELEVYSSRGIHCYTIAPPPVINVPYAKKYMPQLENLITAFIFETDMIPRLQWRTIMNTRASVIRLLKSCQQSAWWVYRNGLTADNGTIVDALTEGCPYLSTSHMTDAKLWNEMDTTSLNISSAIASSIDTVVKRASAKFSGTSNDEDTTLSVMPQMKKGGSALQLSIGIEEGSDEDEENKQDDEEEHLDDEKIEIDIQEPPQSPDIQLDKGYNLLATSSSSKSREDKDKRGGGGGKRSEVECLKSAMNSFARDINRDYKEMSHHSVEMFGPSLWNTRYQHCGNVFHIVRASAEPLSSHPICNFMCSAVYNCARCKPCDTDASKYIVYRADPSGFDQLIISTRMAADHMPHVYLNVMTSLDLDTIHLLSQQTHENDIKLENN